MPRGLPNASLSRATGPWGDPKEGVTSEIEIARRHFPSIELPGGGRKGQYMEFRGRNMRNWEPVGRLEADSVSF